jgi:hypothetical protein
MANVQEPAPLSCQDLEAQHAAYAWDALEPEERGRVEEHRRQCSRCDERLRGFEQVTSRLDYAAPKVDPPAHLRGRVLGAIAELANEQPRETDTTPPIVLETHRERRNTRRPHSGPYLAGVATGVAGALAVAALAVLLIVGPESFDATSPRGSQLGPDQPLWSPRSWSLPFGGPSSPSNRLVELRSSSGSGRGVLAYDTNTWRGVLLLQELGSPPGTPYAVWLISGAQRAELGRFQVEGDGFGTFVLPQPLPLVNPERIEVAPASGESGSVLAATF